MWFAIFSLRIEHGRRFVIPVPVLLLWPFLLLGGFIALVIKARAAFRYRHVIWSSILLLPRMGGFAVHVTSRDGVEFGCRLI